MKRFTCLRLVGLLCLSTFHSNSVAQPLECGADDRKCLEASFSLACGQMESRESFEESCLTWVGRVQAHALAQHPEWKLVAGLGFMLLMDRAESPEAGERFRDESRSIYNEVAAIWPNTRYEAQAYIGLSGLADDLDESIALQRDAWRLDPENTAMPFMLARWTEMRARTTRQDSDYGEAADLYRQAYSLGFPASWYSASNALRLYSQAGDTDQIEQFRDQVAVDSGMIEFAEDVMSPEFADDLVRAEEVLETACHRHIMDIFGPATCANGIDTLVAATRTTPSLAQRRAIADVAAGSMHRLTVLGAGTSEERNERTQRFGTVLREWIETGVVTETSP